MSNQSTTPTDGSRVEVGNFVWEAATNQITGPADYVQSDRYRERIERCQDGRDAIVNVGMGLRQVRTIPEVVALILTSLQTDYAAYLGQRQFEAAMGRH